VLSADRFPIEVDTGAFDDAEEGRYAFPDLCAKDSKMDRVAVAVVVEEVDADAVVEEVDSPILVVLRVCPSSLSPFAIDALSERDRSGLISKVDRLGSNCSASPDYHRIC
jgi:hypothetical protein